MAESSEDSSSKSPKRVVHKMEVESRGVVTPGLKREENKEDDEELEVCHEQLIEALQTRIGGKGKEDDAEQRFQ